MAQEYKPGETVPQSGISIIKHDPLHADMPHIVTVIKCRRFPTCRHCTGITFELAHAAKHVSEIDHFEEAHAVKRRPEPAPMRHKELDAGLNGHPETRCWGGLSR